MASNSDEDEFELTDAERFCKNKAAAFVKRIKELITPEEMYLMGCVGGYHAKGELMCWRWPGIFLHLTDEICDAFRAFSDWKYMRAPGVPRNKAELDSKNEEWIPYRNMLLEHFEHRIADNWDLYMDEILNFYKKRALYRWKRIRIHVRLQSIVWYWVHVTNRPGGVGYLQGMMEICA